MRDAFGGAFMIQIFLVFILIYICFTAMSLNYAKAFKVKNEIIEYLEKNEISDLCTLNVKELTTMENYFESEIIGPRGYNVSEYTKYKNNGFTKNEENQCIGYHHMSGFEITMSGKASNTEGVYYKVSTYASWGVPFLNKILELNGNNKKEDVMTGVWKISGETRLIVNE